MMPTPVERRWSNGDGTETVKWRIRYKNGLGKTVDKLFDTKRAANGFVQRLDSVREEERKAAEQEQTQAAEATKPKKTLYEAAKAWIDAGEVGRDGKPPLEGSTIVFYRELLSFARRAGDDLDLSTLTKDKLADYRDRLITESASREQAERVWRSLVKPALAWSQEQEWTAFVVPKSMRIELQQRDIDPEELDTRTHSPEDMKRLLDLAEKKAKSFDLRVSKPWKRYVTILHILTFGGLRPSELRGLPPEAVNVAASTIRIRQKADRHGKLGSPKSRNSYRTISYGERSMRLIKTWMGMLPKDAKLVFETETGLPIARKYLADLMWTPLQREAQVPELPLYSMRHFFASRLISKGCTLLELQKAMGHHDPAFTLKIYGHMFGGEEAAKRKQALAEAISL